MSTEADYIPVLKTFIERLAKESGPTTRSYTTLLAYTVYHSHGFTRPYPQELLAAKNKLTKQICCHIYPSWVKQDPELWSHYKVVLEKYRAAGPNNDIPKNSGRKSAASHDIHASDSPVCQADKNIREKMAVQRADILKEIQMEANQLTVLQETIRSRDQAFRQTAKEVELLRADVTRRENAVGCLNADILQTYNELQQLKRTIRMLKMKQKYVEYNLTFEWGEEEGNHNMSMRPYIPVLKGILNRLHDERWPADVRAQKDLSTSVYRAHGYTSPFPDSLLQARKCFMRVLRNGYIPQWVKENKKLLEKYKVVVAKVPERAKLREYKREERDEDEYDEEESGEDEPSAKRYRLTETVPRDDGDNSLSKSDSDEEEFSICTDELEDLRAKLARSTESVAELQHNIANKNQAAIRLEHEAHQLRKELKTEISARMDRTSDMRLLRAHENCIRSQIGIIQTQQMRINVLMNILGDLERGDRASAQLDSDDDTHSAAEDDAQISARRN